MTTKTETPKAEDELVAYKVTDDTLVDDGIRDGYTVIANKDAKPKRGELALVFTPGGEVAAKRVTSRDLKSWWLIIGRIVQSYLIPSDCEYLVLRDMKNW